ncbi:MAG: hypothetical protein ACJASO_001021 [Cyclobacteriaceae bacterium]|jgi:hypothetical protein
MRDVYFDFLQQKKKSLEATSYLVYNQIRDLKEIANQATGKWEKIVLAEIDLLINLNEEAVSFSQASEQLHLLQRHRIITLEEMVHAYSQQDDQKLIEILTKALKNAKN